MLEFGRRAVRTMSIPALCALCTLLSAIAVSGAALADGQCRYVRFREFPERPAVAAAFDTRDVEYVEACSYPAGAIYNHVLISAPRHIDNRVCEYSGLPVYRSQQSDTWFRNNPAARPFDRSKTAYRKYAMSGAVCPSPADRRYVIVDGVSATIFAELLNFWKEITLDEKSFDAATPKKRDNHKDEILGKSKAVSLNSGGILDIERIEREHARLTDYIIHTYSITIRISDFAYCAVRVRHGFSGWYISEIDEVVV